MTRTYEQSISRVEVIVATLGNDAKPLSDAVSLFEEAVDCLRDASSQLSAVEAKVKILVEESSGVLSERDL
jgi:exodeoxyribonuclease VII small subunit